MNMTNEIAEGLRGTGGGRRSIDERVDREGTPEP